MTQCYCCKEFRESRHFPDHMEDHPICFTCLDEIEAIDGLDQLVTAPGEMIV